MAGSNTKDGNYEERAALYYPYIHIRSENWLKSAILAFQQVKRIVPYAFTLADAEITHRYCELTGADGLQPLLFEANIHTERVIQAQTHLFARLKEHEKALVQFYSKGRTPKEFRSGRDAFQIHRMKVLDSQFSDWLVSKGLAWDTREPQEQDPDWFTVHPRFGAAIMTVLALAVARENGLLVVTPSQHAHQMLLANTEERVLAKLLQVPISLDDKLGNDVTVQELCQVVLMTGFDLTRLTPEDIRDMVVNGGRDLRKFYGNLSRLVANIPTDLGEEERARRLKAKADEVLEDWRTCTEKLPQLKEAIKNAASGDGLKKTIDIVKEAVVANSFVHFLGGLPGIALAIVTKAGCTMMHRHATPYPFLNRMEKAVDKRIGSLYVPQWRELAS
ncbi:MAG TPA: hypothetical protein VLC51_04485 [Nitrospira sp.]|nr:hypothetical protein [Nitrospira sp.]